MNLLTPVWYQVALERWPAIGPRLRKRVVTLEAQMRWLVESNWLPKSWD